MGRRIKRIGSIGQTGKSTLELVLGRGGGQVVSVLAFYSDDPSLIPAELFSVKLCWKRTKINKKRPVLTTLKRLYWILSLWNCPRTS